ncbi:MAG: class I SAM-dependent methyltransferase [Caldilineaceae bacterium]
MLVDGDVVLELGCGTGALLPHLAAPGRTLLGLDASPAMLRRARARVTDDVTGLLRGRAQSLPLPATSVDCVVATFPRPTSWTRPRWPRCDAC